MNRLRAFFHSLFVENFVLKAIALILTLALFIWVREDREAAVTGFAPVRLVMPENMVLTSPPVDRVRVTVRGRWSELSDFDPSHIEPITIRLEPKDDGELLPVTAEQIKIPPALRVVNIQPDHIRIELSEETEKTVPIRPRIIGQPRESFRVGEVKVTPAKIEVTGPTESVDELQFVTTEPIDVSGRSETFTRRVNLRLDDPLIQYGLDTPIRVTVPIDTQEVGRTIQEIPVIAVNTSYRTRIRPQTVNVTVRGPKAIVDELSSKSLQATIDLSSESNKPPGTFEKQPQVKNVPPDVTLVTFHPTDFLVTTLPEEQQQ